MPQPRDAVPRGSDARRRRGIHDFLHVPEVFLQVQYQQLDGMRLLDCGQLMVLGK